MNPVLLVIAGPNGSGKTTVTVRLRQDHWSEGVEYINPDDVARDRFGDWNSSTAILQAAQWAEARRETPEASLSEIAIRLDQHRSAVQRALDLLQVATC